MELHELIKHVITTERDGGDITPKELYRIQGAERLIKEHFGTLRKFYESLGLDADEYVTPIAKATSIRSKCGFLFEEIMADLLYEIMPNVERHKKYKTLIPDFTVGNKIIDAKLTKVGAEYEKNRAKYEPLCEKVILVYLIGSYEDYMISDKTRVVCYSAFYEPLRAVGKGHLINSFERRFDLVRSIATSAEEIREIHLGGILNDEK